MTGDRDPLWANPAETENGYDSRRSNNACIPAELRGKRTSSGKREAGLGAVRRFFFPAAQSASEKSNSKGTFCKDCGSRAQDEWPQLLAAIEHKSTHTHLSNETGILEQGREIW